MYTMKWKIKGPLNIGQSDLTFILHSNLKHEHDINLFSLYSHSLSLFCDLEFKASEMVRLSNNGLAK